MSTLRVTVIGNDIFKIVAEKLELVGINQINKINTGMLGNLKTLTYEIDLEDLDIIGIRKKLIELMIQDNMRIMPLFMASNWLHLFVMKPFKT